MKIFALIAIVIAAVGVWYIWAAMVNNGADYTDQNPDTTLEEVRSFEDCERAGYPVMESYPRQCAVPDGRTYTEEIVVEATYENADEDMIVVELPDPGAVVGKEFKVMGEARGTWFFEASFPIEVVADNGTVLASTHATAIGDWMTTEFVSFSSDIKVPDSYIGPATLILRKDNPSGLPENDASVSFPIVIEY